MIKGEFEFGKHYASPLKTGIQPHPPNSRTSKRSVHNICLVKFKLIGNSTPGKQNMNLSFGFHWSKINLMKY